MIAIQRKTADRHQEPGAFAFEDSQQPGQVQEQIGNCDGAAIRLGASQTLSSGLIGALAHLGLARADTLQGETAKARSAYQDFFALWKDADPDIPVPKNGKSEYSKLK